MNGASDVIEVTIENFQAEVLDHSAQQPVVVAIWADGHDESVAQLGKLKQLVSTYSGKLRLASVDARSQQQLMQHLGVRQLPALKVIQGGQLAGDLEGVQDDASLAGLFDQLTMSPGDQMRDQIDQLIEMGQIDNAVVLLRQTLEQEPNNLQIKCQLSDLLLQGNELAEAKLLLSSIPEDTDGKLQPQTRLILLEAAAEFADLDTLQQQFEASSIDNEVSYQLAIRQLLSNQYEAGLQLLLAIMARDRKFRDDGAKAILLLAFDLMAKTNELVSMYRRKMFNLLH